MTALERMLEKADKAEELSGFEARALCQSLAAQIREIQGAVVRWAEAKERLRDAHAKVSTVPRQSELLEFVDAAVEEIA